MGDEWRRRDTLLLIEPDDFSRASIGRGLRNLGYRVLVVRTAADAGTILRTYVVDLAIGRLSTPDISAITEHVVMLWLSPGRLAGDELDAMIRRALDARRARLG